MNAITEAPSGALALSENELIEVLQASIYPGAKLESIKMAVAYCKAARLDPMLKPVHIVPMLVKKPGTRDQYEWRDVVMPGIGLYRIQAARTGALAGIDEPEFGSAVELELDGMRIVVPEWCRVTVYRLVGGVRCPFTAKEYWLENYAAAGRDTERPNAMWKRRTRGQLAKCAEAQALRKGFPEVGAQPTAEEMAGRTLELDGDLIVDITDTPQAQTFKVGRKSLPEKAGGEPLEQPQPKSESAPAADPAGSTSARTEGGGAAPDAKPERFKPMLSQQKKMIEARLKTANLTIAELEAHFGKKLEATGEAGFAFSDYKQVEKWISQNSRA